MDITLYFTPQTRAIRPRWILEELGLDYTLQIIDLFAGEGELPAYKKINPLGAVPAMEIDGKVMLESGAMCHWLADLYADKKLAPAIDDSARLQYEQWMMFAQATLEPQPWLMLLHTKILPEAERVEAIVPWAEKRNQQVLTVLNSAIGNNEYILGDVFSAADIMLASTLMFEVETLLEFPKLQDYIQRLQKRPAFQRAAK